MTFDNDYKEKFNEAVNNADWKGTEKQIAWAKKIKSQRMKELVTFMTNYEEYGIKEDYLKNALWLAQNCSAPSWIDTRSKDTMYLVENLKVN